MGKTAIFQTAVLLSATGLACSILMLATLNQNESRTPLGTGAFRELAKTCTLSMVPGGAIAWATASWKTGSMIFLSLFLILFLIQYRQLLHTRKRERDIDRELPLLLDFLVLQVEAGNSISQALKSSSTLFPETSQIKKGLSRFQQKVSIGSPVRHSLEDLAAHFGTIHSETAILAISQAMAHGTPLGAILMDLSKRMRTHLIMEGEKFANTLSIKLLIPLVFFIFPASFLVIFCPVLVSLHTLFP